MYRPKAKEVVAEEEGDKFYWLKILCTNCGLSKSLAFKKGDEYKEYICPNCETSSLVNNTHE